MRQIPTRTDSERSGENPDGVFQLMFVEGGLPMA